MRIVFDVKCNACSHTYEDYDYPGQPNYGNCTECENGTMHQVVCGPKTIIMHAAKSGTTKNGMKWSVDPKPRIYNAKNGKFGSRV